LAALAAIKGNAAIAEIAEIASKAGAEVYIRPPELAEDNTPTLPVLQHIVAQLREPFEAVMTLQPTSPFRRTQHIDEAIALFAQYPEADSLVSVVKIPHQYSPVSAMQMDKKAWLTPFLPREKTLTLRQEKPAFWARNGAAIYLTRTDRLADFVFGGKILAYEMGKLESLDLDDLEDWVIAEGMVKMMQDER
jgi:CMP-N-acetylneuraminic acid synthetase